MRLTVKLVGVLGVACGAGCNYASKEEVADLRQRVDRLSEDLAQLRTRNDAGSVESQSPTAPAPGTAVSVAPTPTNGAGWWCYRMSRCWKTEEECRFVQRSDVYIRRDPNKDGVSLFNHVRNSWERVKWDDIQAALGSGNYSYTKGMPEIDEPPVKGDCTMERGAACIDLEWIVDKSKVRECYVSMTACEARRTNLLSGSAADVTIVASCAPG